MAAAARQDRRDGRGTSEPAAQRSGCAAAGCAVRRRGGGAHPDQQAVPVLGQDLGPRILAPQALHPRGHLLRGGGRAARGAGWAAARGGRIGRPGLRASAPAAPRRASRAGSARPPLRPSLHHTQTPHAGTRARRAAAPSSPAPHLRARHVLQEGQHLLLQVRQVFLDADRRDVVLKDRRVDLENVGARLDRHAAAAAGEGGSMRDGAAAG